MSVASFVDYPVLARMLKRKLVGPQPCSMDISYFQKLVGNLFVQMLYLIFQMTRSCLLGCKRFIKGFLIYLNSQVCWWQSLDCQIGSSSSISALICMSINEQHC